MKWLMHISTIIVAVMFMACTVIQFHHHHDDESICLLIHCDGEMHAHHHHDGDDSHSMCNNHSHGDEGNCSLHLSETTMSPQKSLIDHSLTTHIISSILVTVAQLIPLPDYSESRTYLPRLHTLGKPQKAHSCGWTLRAPPCL